MIALIAGLTGFAYWRFTQTYAVAWQPLNSWAPGAQYFLKGKPPMELFNALLHAEQLLCTHAPARFTPAQMLPLRSKLKVYVDDMEAWTDQWGRSVAGLTITDVVMVGPSLAALCHELAHFAETRLYGSTDELHTTWQTNGIQRALDVFEAWVKE